MGIANAILICRPLRPLSTLSVCKWHRDLLGIIARRAYDPRDIFRNNVLYETRAMSNENVTGDALRRELRDKNRQTHVYLRTRGSEEHTDRRIEHARQNKTSLQLPFRINLV